VSVLKTGDTLFVQLLQATAGEREDMNRSQDQQCLQWRVGTLKGAMVWDTCQHIESWWQFSLHHQTQPDAENMIPYFTLTDLRSKKCLASKNQKKVETFISDIPVEKLPSALQLTKCDHTNSGLRWIPSAGTEVGTHGLHHQQVLTKVIFRTQMLITADRREDK
jgi:hypothetical protein